jgi:predicted dienelactone hydrolase
MKASVLVTTIISAVVWLCSAGESAADTPGVGTGLPDELGPFRVGHITIQMVGTGTLGEPRPIDAEVWYPADQEAWFAASPSEYSSRLRGVPLVPSKWDPLSWALLSDASHEDVPFDKHGPFPVILFSHSATGRPFAAFTILEHLASHGYVVVAPWHQGDTFEDFQIGQLNTLNGSKVLNCLDGFNPPCLDTAAKNMADRALDVKKVLDSLPIALGDNVDMNEVYAMGHSRGSMTALAMAGGSVFFHIAPDPRVKAVLTLASAMAAIIGNLDLQNVTVPALAISGELDTNPPATVRDTLFARLSSEDKALVIVRGARHRGLLGSAFCSEMQATGGVAITDPSRHVLERLNFTSVLTISPNGGATENCNFSYFVNPVDVRPLVQSTIGIAVTPSNVPSAGNDADDIGRLVGTLAVTFFDAVGKAVRHENEPCHDHVCSNVRFNRLLSEKFLLEKEPDVLSTIILTDEDMKQLDCTDNCPD